MCHLPQNGQTHPKNLLPIAHKLFFSGKTSSPVKNSHLPTFPDDKAKILAVCLSHLY